MSTSGTSPLEETVQEVDLLKEQMAEMMRIMQQLVVGGGLNSSGQSQNGPQTKNENQPLLDKNRATMYHPREMTRK